MEPQAAEKTLTPLAGEPLPASVVVLKLQDYARRPVAEQAKLKGDLEALAAKALEPLGAAERIVLDAPDALAVVVLDRPQAALELAERCEAAARELPLAPRAGGGSLDLDRHALPVGACGPVDLRDVGLRPGDPDGPAGDKPILPRYIITRVDGQRVRTMREFQQAMSGVKQGDIVSLHLSAMDNTGQWVSSVVRVKAGG